MSKPRVAVFYGGMSTEHEISVISALQVMHALEESDHQVIPIYISKQGSWYLGDRNYLNPSAYKNLNSVIASGRLVFPPPENTNGTLLTRNSFGQTKVAVQFDVAFPVFHGKYGEDGTIQGFLKLKGVPIAGSTLLASSVGIDKYVSKLIAKSLGIPIVPDILITKFQFQNESAMTVTRIVDALGKKVIIKPSMLGSSIGISIADSSESIRSKLEVAFTLDTRVLVEKLLADPKEVQISVIGNDPYQTSITEQPLKSEDVLSYDDKYVKGRSKKTGSKGMASASRLIPAPISEMQTNQIETYSKTFYSAIGGKGLARVDFLIDADEIYFNEINTIPGSLSFYLWEPSGKPFPQLVSELVTLAIEAAIEEKGLIKTFESNILSRLDISLGKAK